MAHPAFCLKLRCVHWWMLAPGAFSQTPECDGEEESTSLMELSGAARDGAIINVTSVAPPLINLLSLAYLESLLKFWMPFCLCNLNHRFAHKNHRHHQSKYAFKYKYEAGDDAFKLICWFNDVIKHDHGNCLVEASNLIMIITIIISIPHTYCALYFFDEKIVARFVPHSSPLPEALD